MKYSDVHNTMPTPKRAGCWERVNLKNFRLLGIILNVQICTKISCFQPASHGDVGGASTKKHASKVFIKP